MSSNHWTRSPSFLNLRYSVVDGIRILIPVIASSPGLIDFLIDPAVVRYAWNRVIHTSGSVKDDQDVWLNPFAAGQVNIGVMGVRTQGEKT
jgi:hypothetical protein